MLVFTCTAMQPDRVLQGTPFDTYALGWTRKDK